MVDCHRKYAGNTVEREIVVNVNSNRTPIVLAFTAYNPTLWKVVPKDGVKITKVILGGYHAQRVTGVPPETPLEVYTYDTSPCERCFHAKVYFESYVNPPERLKEITGLAVKSFQGQYEGLEFSIPLEESKAPTSNPPKLAAPKVVAPHVALETAILDGIIRHATVDDVNEFYSAYVYKKYTKNKLSVPAHETALDVTKVNIARAYVVLREFIYPEGMVDDHRVVFFVPRDVPGPTGDIGHSATYEFATLMVTCTAARTGKVSC
jgi:hypothetical protein